jgi:transposase
MCCETIVQFNFQPTSLTSRRTASFKVRTFFSKYTSLHHIYSAITVEKLRNPLTREAKTNTTLRKRKPTKWTSISSENTLNFFPFISSHLGSITGEKKVKKKKKAHPYYPRSPYISRLHKIDKIH